MLVVNGLKAVFEMTDTITHFLYLGMQLLGVGQDEPCSLSRDENTCVFPVSKDEAFGSGELTIGAYFSAATFLNIVQ